MDKEDIKDNLISTVKMLCESINAEDIEKMTTLDRVHCISMLMGKLAESYK